MRLYHLIIQRQRTLTGPTLLGTANTQQIYRVLYLMQDYRRVCLVLKILREQATSLLISNMRRCDPHKVVSPKLQGKVVLSGISVSSTPLVAHSVKRNFEAIRQRQSKYRVIRKPGP